MKINMKELMKTWLEADRKKAVPILTFPIAQKMGLTVTELLSEPGTQAKGLQMLVEETDMWAVLTYMDLSIEAEAFGGIVDFKDNEIPNVADPILKTREDVEALQVPEVGAGRTVLYIEGCRQAVELVGTEDRPVFAGCIGPFSLAGRLMDISDVMMKCKREPETVHMLLEKATEFIIKYAGAYKEAGANGIAMAEPLAGLMPPKLLKEFSSVYVKRIVDELQDDEFAFIYHNCGASTIKSVEEIVMTGCQGYHFGNAIDMAKMVEIFPEDKLIMGNIDPATEFCNGTPESMRKATLDVMNACCGHKNFVISSGCDIPAHSPWENINAFFNAINEYYDNK